MQLQGRPTWERIRQGEQRQRMTTATPGSWRLEMKIRYMECQGTCTYETEMGRLRLPWRVDS